MQLRYLVHELVRTLIKLHYPSVVMNVFQSAATEVQATPQLPVGAQPHGEELPTGHSGRPESQLRQLCHMLGENGDGTQTAVRSLVP